MRVLHLAILFWLPFRPQAAAQEGKDLQELLKTFRDGRIEKPAGAPVAPPRSRGPVIEALESFFGGAFRIAADRDQRVVRFDNGRRDRFVLSLKDPAERHVYELEANGAFLALSAAEFRAFALAYDLGPAEPADQVLILCRQIPVEDAPPDDMAAAALLSAATRLLAYVPRDASSRRVLEGPVWGWLAGAFPRDTGRHPLKDLPSPPEALSWIVRHAVRVHDASGTIVRLPTGGLGVATAEHVAAPRPHPSRPVEVLVEGRRYRLEPRLAPPNEPTGHLLRGDDLALLVFSESDSGRLLEAGYEGVPIAAAAPGRLEPVVALGFGGAGGQLSASRGYLWTDPKSGSGKTAVSAGRYNGEKRMWVGFPQKGLFSSTAWVIGGDSGGGVFRLNPATGRFELLGVHVTNTFLDIDAEARPTDSNLAALGFHALLDVPRAARWLSGTSADSLSTPSRNVP